MKRLILLTLLAILIISSQLLLNCSKPLESTDGNGYDPVNPIIIYDTTFITDTIIINDTSYVDTLFVYDTIIDTIIITDTVTIVDTVIVIVPDTGDSFKVCSRIGPAVQEIVWMFDNNDGDYRLEFTAEPESVQPPQKILVCIDGTPYTWLPVESRDFTVEQELDDNATIKISLLTPKAYGHEIDICIKLIPL